MQPRNRFEERAPNLDRESPDFVRVCLEDAPAAAPRGALHMSFQRPTGDPFRAAAVKKWGGQQTVARNEVEKTIYRARSAGFRKSY